MKVWNAAYHETYQPGDLVEFRVTVHSMSGGFPMWLEGRVVAVRPGVLRLAFGEGAEVVLWETCDWTKVRPLK
jgi:hypothetical protein